jgi:hypothetical protein
MPRRPAKVTQADIARAIRAAKEAGGNAVTIDGEGVARAEVAAYANCTESQMMAMFGWTDPKMPAHYIAQANREKLGSAAWRRSSRSIRASHSMTFCSCQKRTGCERLTRTEW